MSAPSLRPATGRESPPRHQSRELCAELAGSPRVGRSVVDLADLIAQYLENSEDLPVHRSPKAPTGPEVKLAIVRILEVLSRATCRIVELEQENKPHD